MTAEDYADRRGGDQTSTLAEDVSPQTTVDRTPTAEVPISVNISTPSTVMAELARHHKDGSGYFTAHPAEDEAQQQQHLQMQRRPSQQIFSPITTPLPASGTSNATASGQFQRPDFDASLLPSAEHSISSQTAASTSSSGHSVESNTTVADTTSTTTIRPSFPNQSYAALHSQQYPPLHPAPPPRRQMTTHPGQIHTFSSALATIHQSGSRTVGNTPAVSPNGGLFASSQNIPLDLPNWEPVSNPGTYASPYLHFTQRVPPKTTYKAEVERDMVSGRKMVNHYEILDELGRGTHGKVKLGRDCKTGDFVAIKIVQRFSKRRRLGKLGTTEDKVKKEIAILKKARHPNVVALLEVIDDPDSKKVYLVLEWVERGEIQWRVKAPKDIAMLEARRYESEKNGLYADVHSSAVDIAVALEARRRLERQKRRQQRTFRRARRETSGDIEAWSNEMNGDDESDLSDSDRQSHASTATRESCPNVRSTLDDVLLMQGTTVHASSSQQQQQQANRPQSEAAAQLHTIKEHYLSNNAGERSTTSSPIAIGFGQREVVAAAAAAAAAAASSSSSSIDPLEGTMYGAYSGSVSHSPRLTSVPSSARSSISALLHGNHIGDSDRYRQLAVNALDAELNEELQYVPIMTLQRCRVAFRDTLLGLQYLHSQGIIHRDIKPPNLLSTINGRVKISDFGVSYLGRPIRDDEAGEDVSEHEAQDLDEDVKELAKTVGTPAFYAPELCIQESWDETLPITKAIDVWALGITLFCMLFARTPFVEDQYVIMRQIAEQEVYIPRRRLRPVEGERQKSRASSRTRHSWTHGPPEYRAHLDIAYEEIDDDLHSLLRGLLIKDPRKRMTLEDVRRHAWVQADVIDKARWLEETDPARQTQGRKIEISKEDLNTAVVPLFDRVRHHVKKVLGLGSSSKSSSRGRAQSNASAAGGQNSPAPSSTASSSSNISQDARRYGVFGDESAALPTAHRNGEYPVSSRGFEPGSSHPSHHPDPASVALDSIGVELPLRRPNAPERATTIMATGGSMRTVRQSDFGNGRHDSTPPLSPGLPGTPTVVDPPQSSGGGLWGAGVARRILNTVREKSTARSSRGRDQSSDRASVASIDTHGEPSVAMSQMTATGHVHRPSIYDDIGGPTSNPTSAHHSPVASRPHSLIRVQSGERLGIAANDAGFLSRTSSGGSLTSPALRYMSAAIDSIRGSPGSTSRPQSRMAPESSAEEWDRAEREFIRKRIAEERESRQPVASEDSITQHIAPDEQRIASSNDANEGGGDDGLESRRTSNLSIPTPASSHGTSVFGAQLPSAMVSSTSDFGSTVSASISNLSIPSVISEYDSSMDHHDHVPGPDKKPNDAAADADNGYLSSDDTVDPLSIRSRRENINDDHDRSYHEYNEYNDDMHSSDAEGLLYYDHDADDDMGGSEDDDDDDDSDGGLVMTRRRSSARSKRPSTSGGGDDFSRSPKLSRRSTASSAQHANFTPRPADEHAVQTAAPLEEAEDEQAEAA